MKILTLIELMHMSRIELCDLSARITNHLPDCDEGSPAEHAARTNLWNIRYELARRITPAP